MSRGHISNLLISAYNIKNIDYMGYAVNENNISYHHVIIPSRNGGSRVQINGVPLNSRTSHPYLHIIEARDYEIFYRITKELIEEIRMKGIQESNLLAIDDLLNNFEREHSQDLAFNGEPLIREEYTKRLYK